MIQASSLGRTALEAETLAKMAFLSGPDGARRILAEHGGLIVLDDGTVETVGSAGEGAADRGGGGGVNSARTRTPDSTSSGSPAARSA